MDAVRTREYSRPLRESVHWPVPLTLHGPSSKLDQNAWDPLSIDAPGQSSRI